LARALDVSRLKQQEMEALLKVRAAELRDAQVSLGKPHSISHGDVQRMVDKLNAEVYQMSALITDQLQFEEKRSSWHFQRSQSAYEHVNCVVGSGLAYAVAICSHGGDPTLAQVTIQAYCVERISWAVQTWSLFTEPSHNAVLKTSTQRSSKGPQAISAQWRTLTRRYMRQQTPTPSPLYASLMNGLVDILVLAGVLLPPNEVRSRIRISFGEKASAIVEHAMELRKAVGEEMVSSEFEILCPRYNDPFLSDLVEDAEGQGSPRASGKVLEGEPVLCTTEMGLYRYEKKTANGSRGTVEKKTLIKAQVVLCSM
ncbi:hypothetical protein BC835DRAFT_1253227, partial [Cytidiella melzeri]